MIEYGHGVGEVSGRATGGEGNPVGNGGGSGDVGGAAVDALSGAVDRVAALPPEQLLLAGIMVLAGLVVLKRAF